MKRALLLFLIILGTEVSAQKNFSLDVSYPIELNDESSSSLTGIVNGRLKYRFVNSGLFAFGGSYSIDLLNGEISTYGSLDSEKKNFITHHVNVFAEHSLKSDNNFRFALGIGYSSQTYFTSITTGFENNSQQITSNTKKESIDGFNLNAGASYDIAKNLFVQVYYQFIRLYAKNPITDENMGYNTSRLKLGLGFRF